MALISPNLQLSLTYVKKQPIIQGVPEVDVKPKPDELPMSCRKLKNKSKISTPCDDFVAPITTNLNSDDFFDLLILHFYLSDNS